jgi:hypothetical protein
MRGDRVDRERGPSVLARAVRSGLAGGEGAPPAALLEEAAGAAVAGAVGQDGPVAAFRALFDERDVVGLKVNTLAGRRLAPSPALVKQLTGWLQEAGVPARQILVWDRSDRELRGAGFTLRRGGSGVRCYGTGQDYEWTPREWGPGASCFARVLVDELTSLINVGIVKDHDLAGVSAALKNWYGVIHNPNKYHDDGCHPFVAHLAAHPLIRDKQRLTVVDAIRPQCHGGPAASPRWQWEHEGIWASTDPVAVDAAAWKLIDDQRSERDLATLSEVGRAPRWLAEAAKLGLGENDPERIRVEDV